MSFALFAAMRSLTRGGGEHVHGAVAVPGRCHFDGEGKLQGPVSVRHNSPFPCVNGSYGSGAMDGVLMHTMVGQLQPGTVSVFNNPSFQASAHFGISQAGEVWQFGPVGKGWIAWHAEAANATYYGIEHADNGNPDNPLTAAQIAASAQVVEALSAFAGFPLQEANAPGEKGYGVHSMGGAAYGGHTCPDLPPHHVRSAQRPAILALARDIRGGTASAPAPSSEYVTDGRVSWVEIAAEHKTTAAYLLRLNGGPGEPFPEDMRAYINDGNLKAPMPAKITVRVPG
jgi:N-acetylmuramoyl-L-alanine amidase